MLSSRIRQDRKNDPRYVQLLKVFSSSLHSVNSKRKTEFPLLTSTVIFFFHKSLEHWIQWTQARWETSEISNSTLIRLSGIFAVHYLEAFSAFQEVSSKHTGISRTAVDMNEFKWQGHNWLQRFFYWSCTIVFFFNPLPTLSPFSIACRQYHAGAWLPVLRWGSWLDGGDFQPWGGTADCQPLDFPSL